MPAPVVLRSSLEAGQRVEFRREEVPNPSPDSPFRISYAGCLSDQAVRPHLGRSHDPVRDLRPDLDCCRMPGPAVRLTSRRADSPPIWEMSVGTKTRDAFPAESGA